jgi:hypothetical protein
MSWSRRASALLICVAVLAACEQAPAPPPPVPALRPAPTVAKLGALEYTLSAFDGARVRLVGGRYDAPPDAPSAEVLVASSELHPLSGIGDLDHDGSPDAVVVLLSSGGGSGTFFELVVVLNTAQGLTPLPSVTLGDRIDLRRLEVRGGAVSVEFLMAGPDDAMCCPRTPAQRAFRVEGGQLVPIDAVPAAL